MPRRMLRLAKRTTLLRTGRHAGGRVAVERLLDVVATVRHRLVQDATNSDDDDNDNRSNAGDDEGVLNRRGAILPS